MLAALRSGDAMTRPAVRRIWPWAVGLAAGALLVPALLDEYAAWRDQQRAAAERRQPVIRTDVRLVERTADAAVVHVTGVKLRSCDYKGLQAYALEAGLMRAVDVQRLGLPPENTTRPIGAFDAGYWRVSVPHDRDAVVWAAYDCGDGALVFNVFARVPP